MRRLAAAVCRPGLPGRAAPGRHRRDSLLKWPQLPRLLLVEDRLAFKWATPFDLATKTAKQSFAGEKAAASRRTPRAASRGLHAAHRLIYRAQIRISHNGQPRRLT